MNMSEIRIRKRKRMREKDAKSLALLIEEAAGTSVFEDEPVDIAESTDYKLIFVGGEILGLIYEEKIGRASCRERV